MYLFTIALASVAFLCSSVESIMVRPPLTKILASTFDDPGYDLSFRWDQLNLLSDNERIYGPPPNSRITPMPVAKTARPSKFGRTTKSTTTIETFRIVVPETPSLRQIDDGVPNEEHLLEARVASDPPIPPTVSGSNADERILGIDDLKAPIAMPPSTDEKEVKASLSPVQYYEKLGFMIWMMEKFHDKIYQLNGNQARPIKEFSLPAPEEIESFNAELSAAMGILTTSKDLRSRSGKNRIFSSDAETELQQAPKSPQKRADAYLEKARMTGLDARNLNDELFSSSLDEDDAQNVSNSAAIKRVWDATRVKKNTGSM